MKKYTYIRKDFIYYIQSLMFKKANKNKDFLKFMLDIRFPITYNRYCKQINFI